MTEQFYTDPIAREHLYTGPLSLHIDGLSARLASQGYAKSTAKEKLRLVADLSRWLHREKLPVAALNEQQINLFLACRRRGTRVRHGDAATCRMLLRYLRDLGRIPFFTEVIDDSPLNYIAHDFRRFLTSERGLSPATLINYLPIVRRFLSEQFGNESLRLDKLCPHDVHRFILHHARSVSRSRAKLMATALRSFLRFLYQRGDTLIDLAETIPSMTNWRMSELPKSLTSEQVERLLASCDLCTTIGQRDYAILLLLARLGLRAGEVVALTLDDFDWEAGTFIVRGKGNRQEQLPLPQDVGEALVNYLCHSRPRCATRRLFVRLQAPQRGFASSVAICDVVRRALARAGLDPTLKGAHLLRHSLATHMLGYGASLEEIGQILRHQHPETTQIYAKVDLNALRALAQPWPGGTS